MIIFRDNVIYFSPMQIIIPKSNDTSKLPTRHDHESIHLGDVCVFQNTNSSEWKLGKLLQFFYHIGKNSK